MRSHWENTAQMPGSTPLQKEIPTDVLNIAGMVDYGIIKNIIVVSTHGVAATYILQRTDSSSTTQAGEALKR